MQKVAGERYVYKFVCDPEALFSMAFPDNIRPVLKTEMTRHSTSQGRPQTQHHDCSSNPSAEEHTQLMEKQTAKVNFQGSIPLQTAYSHLRSSYEMPNISEDQALALTTGHDSNNNGSNSQSPSSSMNQVTPASSHMLPDAVSSPHTSSHRQMVPLVTDDGNHCSPSSPLQNQMPTIDGHNFQNQQHMLMHELSRVYSSNPYVDGCVY